MCNGGFILSFAEKLHLFSQGAEAEGHSDRVLGIGLNYAVCGLLEYFVSGFFYLSYKLVHIIGKKGKMSD